MIIEVYLNDGNLILDDTYSVELGNAILPKGDKGNKGDKGDTGNGISRITFDPVNYTFTLYYTNGENYTTESFKTDILNSIAEEPVITEKADKVQNATNGNFAGLDSNGNLTDSGSSPSDYVQKTAYATNNAAGVVKINFGGLEITSEGYLRVLASSSSGIKTGTAQYSPIVPATQHIATFYGLAKVAGANMASSSNAVGTYTEQAKRAICAMIGAKYDE